MAFFYILNQFEKLRINLEFPLDEERLEDTGTSKKKMEKNTKKRNQYQEK